MAATSSHGAGVAPIVHPPVSSDASVIGARSSTGRLVAIQCNPEELPEELALLEVDDCPLSSVTPLGTVFVCEGDLLVASLKSVSKVGSQQSMVALFVFPELLALSVEMTHLNRELEVAFLRVVLPRGFKFRASFRMITGEVPAESSELHIQSFPALVDEDFGPGGHIQEIASTYDRGFISIKADGLFGGKYFACKNSEGAPIYTVSGDDVWAFGVHQRNISCGLSSWVPLHKAFTEREAVDA